MAEQVTTIVMAEAVTMDTVMMEVVMDIVTRKTMDIVMEEGAVVRKLTAKSCRFVNDIELIIVRFLGTYTTKNCIKESICIFLNLNSIIGSKIQNFNN